MLCAVSWILCQKVSLRSVAGTGLFFFSCRAHTPHGYAHLDVYWSQTSQGSQNQTGMGAIADTPFLMSLKENSRHQFLNLYGGAFKLHFATKLLTP